MRRPLQYFLVFMTIAFFASCTKEVPDNIIDCDPVLPYVTFRVVDKTSGADLFFSDKPKYQLKDINLFRIKDVKYKDPIKLRNGENGAGRVFVFNFNNSLQRDTLIIKIANTPEDRLIYSVKTPANHCEGATMDKVIFNNVEVNVEKGLMILKK